MSMCSIARMSFHGNGDFLRVQRRVEGEVRVVREQELERVLARRQGQRRLGLALAEVHDLVGRRQGRIELDLAQIRVHQEMMMPGIVEFDSRRRHSHPLQAEAHRNRSVDLGAVARRDDIYLGIRRRRGSLLRHGDGRDQREGQGEKWSIHCGSPGSSQLTASYSRIAAYVNRLAAVLPSTTIYRTKSAKPFNEEPNQPPSNTGMERSGYFAPAPRSHHAGESAPAVNSCGAKSSTLMRCETLAS